MSKRVGDLIQYPEIEKWNNGNIILINAPTGSGKSFWVITYLLSYSQLHNKNILWLTNRKLTKEQSKVLIEKNSNNITIMNYQKVEYMILNNEIIPQYDYIVADECHYFFSDALFNRNTELVLNWLFLQDNSIRILMSAIGNTIEKYLQHCDIETIQYKINPDYSHINKFYFYNNVKVIEKLLFELPPDEKVIYFSSVNKARYINKKFSNSEFICSDYNSQKKYSNIQVKEQIVQNQKFDCQILCCTNVLDTGINIIDKSVKHIIIDFFDLDTVEQCLGRKRILDKNDKVNVYIKNRNRNSLNGTKQLINKEIQQANYLENFGQEEFINKYIKKTYSSLIDIVWMDNKPKVKINNIMKIKYNIDLNNIDEMSKKKEGYTLAVLRRFDWIDKEWKTLDDEMDKITLTDRLDFYTGTKMFKEEQKEFKEYLLNELLNSPKTNHGRVGLKTINALFDDYKLNYYINSKQETSGENRKKTYWIITKL